MAARPQNLDRNKVLGAQEDVKDSRLASVTKLSTAYKTHTDQCVNQHFLINRRK